MASSKGHSVRVKQVCQVVQFPCILYRNSLKIQEYTLYHKNTGFLFVCLFVFFLI